MKTLHGHVPAAVAELQPKGILPSTNRLHLAIGLPLRNTNELDDFLARLYDPASTNFHQYLTPQQFTKQFGPADTDYASVMEFMEQNHLTIEATYRNKLLLDVSGSVEDVERAFHVTMRVYQHPTEARDFYAPDTEPSVSADLPITDISGLNNYVRPRPKSLKRSPEAGTIVGSGPGSGPGGAYIGNDFRAAYLPGVNLTGSGQVVGLLEFDGYYSGDISRYESTAGLPAVPLQTVLLDGYNGAPTEFGNPEVSLDIEMAVSMAPGLSSIVVFEAGPDGSANDVLNTMASSNQVLQLSCSWGWGGGPNSTTDNIFKEMAAQGQSFFCASGDSDAYTSGTDSADGVDDPTQDNAPCSSPYLTSVGGTTLTTTGPGGSWSSETVWNWGSGEGSSGGISSYYAIPSWQANVSMTSNGGSTTHRNLPDVALTADNIYATYGDGGGGAIGGTSCATPLWAALTALMNEQSFEGGRGPVGFINPAIYAIGEGAEYSGSFHDITTGNDTWPSSPNDFYAVGGYDLCTGWGTPNGQALIDAIAGLPDPLGISPPTGFTVSGIAGFPFNAASTVFQLTNSSTNSLEWSLINTSSWLQVSSTGGTLSVGSTDSVTATLSTATADMLAAGTYEAEIEFSNWNSHVVQSIPFKLNVADSLVQNGGFETGDFTDWTLVGDTPVTTPSGTIVYNAVYSSADYPLVVHSGNYGAFLGDFQMATLSQTLATVPGQGYLLSFWLDNPTNGTTQEFEVNWNGRNLYKMVSPPAFAWTNLQFTVTAEKTSSVLQFAAENKAAYFGLDDVRVNPIPGATGTTGSSVSNSLTTNVWQLALTGTASGLKDTGTAFITFNGDGSYTGYGLSTHSGGLFTLSGTWVLGASGEITGTFNESPQSVSGTVTGKASTKQVALSVTATNGIYKFNGKPVSTGNLPDFSGSWNVALKATHTNVVDSILVTSTRGYPGYFGIAAGTNGVYGLSGEALETATGGLTMHISSVSLGEAAALIGKFSPVSGTASLSGKDTNNFGVSVKLTRP